MRREIFNIERHQQGVSLIDTGQMAPSCTVYYRHRTADLYTQESERGGIEIQQERKSLISILSYFSRKRQTYRLVPTNT